MIKIIKSILITDLDNNPGVWNAVPMIPASGTFQSESTVKGSGRLKTVTLDFKVTRILPVMRRNVALTVQFDDDTREFIGTDDLPVTLTINTDNTIRCSCKWSTPEL